MKRFCKLCGKEFTPRVHNQTFCDADHTGVCQYCRETFHIKRSSFSWYASIDKSEWSCGKCDKSKKAKKESQKQAIKKKYGVDNISQLEDVRKKKSQTMKSLYSSTVEKRKATCRKKYGVEYVTQSPEFIEKIKAANQSKYGVDSYFQTNEFQEKAKATNIERYGVEYATHSEEIKEKRKQTFQKHLGVNTPFQSEECKAKAMQTKIEKYGSATYTNPDKAKQTNLRRYGVESIFNLTENRKKQIEHSKSAEALSKRISTTQEKYGVDNVFQANSIKLASQKSMVKKYGKPYTMQIEEIRKKALKNSRLSKFEQRVADIFDTYDIEYMHHYFLSDDKYTHEFDFYIPKYKILIDCDGVYYHSYLSDPDGKHVIDDYDEVRIHLVPSDHIFHVIVEGQEEKDIKKLVDILKSIDEGIFDYNSYMFEWCRSIDFPYPKHDMARMISDYSGLCKYEQDNYIRECRYGESVIQSYHQSIFSCHVGESASPIDAWNDDKLLKKVIVNRLIYTNNVDPSKILRGFNISKICPRVSIFNPVLAKYLVRKYLSEFDEIFDPFSGFSGRLLGVCSTGKRYIGQDLNPKVVDESNQIIRDFNLKGTVIEKDVLKSQGDYSCLLTCPPYGDKEIYNNESVFKSCDEWIHECLFRFNCKRYVFVVDHTSDFAENIVEEIKTSSHYNTISEYVVVI